jgi:hypothetical protein
MGEPFQSIILDLLGNSLVCLIWFDLASRFIVFYTYNRINMKMGHEICPHLGSSNVQMFKQFTVLDKKQHVTERRCALLHCIPLHCILTFIAL